MSNLIVPHGKEEKLIPLLLEGNELKAETERAKSLKQIKITSREASDLIMMGIGAFTPLTGFMTKEDWQGVCDNFTMADGTFWPIPITLSTDDEEVKAGDELALVDEETGTTIATMQVSEKGDLANWSTGAKDAIPAVGGAMDLVAGVKRIFVITQHVTKHGDPKIVKECTYPLTGKEVVERIYSNLAIIDRCKRF